MYKPYTVDQFKLWQFLKERFVLEAFILSPVSRNALMLEDKTGERIVFAWVNHEAVEQPLPEPASPKAIREFFLALRDRPDRPCLTDIEQVTRWWLQNENPLSYQQALGFSDELYRYYLTHKIYSDEEVVALVKKGLVTEEEYLGIQLWYFNGNAAGNWLGPLGIDGTGEIYGLTLRYRKPEQTEYVFYLENDYYRFMNKHKYTAPC
ncbi:MAG: hypothetical protein LIP16_15175 [Clostridium sp.]|nr:hypothetical protein [Clostridium sp.]